MGIINFICIFQKEIPVSHGFRLCVAAALLFVSLSVTNAFSDKFYIGTDDQIEFCKREMAPVLKLYENGQLDQALELLAAAYDRAEAAYDNAYFFNHCVWKEGQIGTGELDAEWGYLLFKFLFDRELEASPWKKSKFTASEYAKIDNIVGCLLDAGEFRKAAGYALMAEDSLLDKGYDTSCESYRKREPIFSFKKDACHRVFPICSKDMGDSRDDPNYYLEQCRILGLVPFALRAGEWTRAAELSAWYIRFADQAVGKGAGRLREICRNAGDAYEALADLCLRYGHPEEACRFYEEFLEKIEDGQYKVPPQTIACRKLDLVLMQIRCGTTSSNMLEVADQAEVCVEKDTKYWGLLPQIRMSKARVLHALGQRGEAWSVIGQELTDLLDTKTPYRRTRLLVTAIELAMKDGGNHPDLEEWFADVLESEREYGDRFGEFPMHDLYADYLSQQDRSAEVDALQIKVAGLKESVGRSWRELVAVSRVRRGRSTSEDRMARLEAARESVMSNSPQRSGKKQAAGKAAVKRLTVLEPDPPVAVPVDIQPENSMFTVRAGDSAYGRFYVHNPARVAQTGTLSLSGPLGELQAIDDVWTSIHAKPGLRRTVRSVEVTIPPETSYVVDILGEPLSGGGGVFVDCQWVASNAGFMPVRSAWGYSPVRGDDSADRIFIEDVHIVRCGQDYMVPVSHAVSLGSLTGTNVDFKVQSAVPARIEFYEGLTGELLAVDANGDGDYVDEGDQVSVDRNENNWPDLEPASEQRVAFFTMYIQPLELIADDDENDLTVSVLSDGEWKVSAVDTLRGYKN